MSCISLFRRKQRIIITDKLDNISLKVKKIGIIIMLEISILIYWKYVQLYKNNLQSS